MSDFTDQLQADAEAIFLNEDEFASEVTWTPGDESKGPRTVTAVVDYAEGFTPTVFESGREVKHRALLFVSTDAVTGIPVAEFDSEHGVFTFDGADWKVEGKPQRATEDAIQRIEVVRFRQREKAPPSYRRTR